MNNEDEMKKMYAECFVIGLSVPESAIRQQADIIAKGLLERDKLDGGTLTILVVLNRMNGGAYVKRQVKSSLEKHVEKSKAAKILAKTHICEAVVNRMVSKVPLSFQIRQIQMGMESLRQSIDETNLTDVLSVYSTEKTGATDEVPSISESLKSVSQLAYSLSDIHFILFDSESDMPLYVAKGSPILEQLRQIKVVDDIKKMQELKIKLSNGTHAIAAWYSSLLGYTTIGQGMGDPRIHELVEKVMTNEIKPAMLHVFPDAGDFIDHFIGSFIERCRSSFKDPCTRVGRDPLRKLQKDERIFGTMRLAHSFGIETPLLEFGAAAGILYALTRKATKGRECLTVQKLYAKNESIRDVLLYQGLYNGKPYQGLSDEDTALIDRIEKTFLMLKDTLFAQKPNLKIKDGA